MRTLASHVAYYQRWAKTWEFQALLKARPVAGDLALGQAYVEAMAPMVWAAAERDDFVVDVQQMRRRVEQTLPAADSHRELKLGPGGLRDVEFAVQLLQLVHGRTDEALRSPNTLEALEALSTYGYVGPRRRRRAGPRLPVPAHRRAPAAAAPAAAHPRHARGPRRAAPARPLGRAARRPGRGAGPRVAPARPRGAPAAREALLPAAAVVGGPAGLGRGPAHAGGGPVAAGGAGLRRPGRRAAAPRGPDRRASAGAPRSSAPCCRCMLGWFADAPDPDGGLLAFRRVSDALGTTHWYLRLLRDEGAVAAPAGPAAGEQPLRGRPARPGARGGAAARRRRRAGAARAAPELATEVAAAVSRHEDPASAVAVARGVRRRELFRVAAADLLGQATVEQVEAALTDVAAVTVQAALDVALRSVGAGPRRTGCRPGSR